LTSHEVKKVKTNFRPEVIFDFPCYIVFLY